MKLPPPSISCFKETATQDTKHAGNRHAQEASPPPDAQPATTQRRHHHSSESWLKNLRKSSPPAHPSHEAPAPSNSQNTLPQAALSHRPTFEVLTEIAKVEKQVIESITAHFSEDALKTSEFKNMVQDCINEGLNALDQKFDHAKQNILPEHSLGRTERAIELAKKRIIKSASKACESLYANELNRVGEEVAGSIANSLPWTGPDTLTISAFKEMENTFEKINNMVQDRLNHGLHALDQKFDHIQQNLLPGQSKETFERTRDIAKERIIKSACEARWTLPGQNGSNITWETGPLLVKRGLSLHQLKLTEENFAEGGFGSISTFENENGDNLIGKISKNNIKNENGGLMDDLANELKAYQTIYDAVGPHPNLVNAYGIVQVPHGTGMKRALLMDDIPGPDGADAFYALRQCWNTGRISSKQYWGAIQFLGQRLLDATEHLGKAGVVHNDIKPENFLVNGNTGEPVLIDFGLWTRSGQPAVGGTMALVSPEATFNFLPVNEKSDVFTVGGSLLSGIDVSSKDPKDGLIRERAYKNRQGNIERNQRTYSEETAYTRFMQSLLDMCPDDRPNSKEAKDLPFIKDRMLDDDAAKEVIKKAFSEAGKEHEKPTEEQWEPAKPQFSVSEKRDQRAHEAIKAFLKNPNLRDHINLRKESKTNPKLKDELAHLHTDITDDITRKAVGEFLKNPNLRNFALMKNAMEDNRDLVKDYLKQLSTDLNIPEAKLIDSCIRDAAQEAANSAKRFIADAPWFDAAKKITTAAIPTGVEEDGAPRNPEHEKIVAYKNAVIQAKKDLGPHANIEELRKYAEEAEAFLRDAMALAISRHNPEYLLEQVMQRAAVARRVVEIFDTDPTPSGTINIQERVRELDRK